MTTKSVIVQKNMEIGNNNPLTLIAGPCVIENERLVMKIAEELKKICEKNNIKLIFKSSFDKANRSAIDSFRGPGIKEGLSILKKVKDKYGLPILTDIHLPEQAESIAEVSDIIQIPAFLCRQTDLVIAAAKTGKVVNLKKGQFMAPWDMKNVIDKCKQVGNEKILLCERGSCFGYNNLVVDMTGLIEMRKLGYPVVFDATHSVQKPGGAGNSTNGNREYVEYLANAATAVGIDAIFMEVHPNPDNALSDGPNMVKLSEVERIMKKVMEIDKVVKNKENGE